MKTLILTCNTGQGHNSTAASIREVFEFNHTQCDIADALSFLSPQASKLITTVHSGIFSLVPKVFDMGYSTSKDSGKMNPAEYLTKAISFGAKKLSNFIIENEYNHVICVHLFAGVLVTNMRQKYRTNVTFSFLPTDYTAYPLVEKTMADLYFMPHEALSELYVQKGVDKKKLIPTGIPIRRAFIAARTKSEARKLLNIAEDEKVILMMCGSLGCGPIKDIAISILEKAPKNTRLLVACGVNKKLLKSLQKLNCDRITAFSYSDNVPQLMAASDVFVTKPGGISITEASRVGLPMVLINLIGACETPNFEFFTAHDYAVGCKHPSEVADKCKELLDSPEKLDELSNRIKANFSKNSTQIIYDHVSELVKNGKMLR